MNCPSCHGAMEQQPFDGRYGRTLQLDLCFTCHAIWFDEKENLLLAPGAVLRLFETIHAHREAARHTLSERMNCPHCTAQLVETHDLQRNTRFSYLRCVEGHGRFITFFQFLREKNIVRTLSGEQLAELKKHVKVIHCSNCGAPVELEKSMSCEHCRAAISMLDPTAVQTALTELKKQDVAQKQPDPTLPFRLFTDKLKAERFYEQLEAEERAKGRGGWRRGRDLLDVGVDLAMSALRQLL